jgi:hypothetical protein
MSQTLGTDRSGNNNNWTVNNITIADQMVDSPTNNFATWNPLKATGTTYSEGNLKIDSPSDASRNEIGTIGVSSGSYYWEYLIANANTNMYLGASKDVNPLAENTGTYTYYSNGSTGRIYTGGSLTATVTAYTTGDIVGFALDVDAATLKFYLNNSLIHTLSSISETTFVPFARIYYATNDLVANFGQDSSFAGNKTAQGNQDGNGIGDFYYTPPTGFLALCTSNLPDVDVVPSEHFNTITYTGDDSTNSITGVGFQPDFVWLKNRSAATNHRLYNSLTYGGPYSAGASGSKYLRSNTTDAELTGSYKSLISLDSDGFTVHSTGSDTNRASDNYVAWNWKANGSGSSNTNGSINSTVSANVDAGFSIVSYTGDGNNGATFGHGLSSTPEIVFIKNRSSAQNWVAWGGGSSALFGRMLLNTTVGNLTSYNATFSSSLVTMPDYDQSWNGNTNNMIAYCFHSVDGYSKVGSYTGNGSTDGTFVYTGFRPAFVMVKRTDAANNWQIFRYDDKTLEANESSAEYGGDYIDIVSNGFKTRSTANLVNGSSASYIYLCFAETPFKYSNAR